MKSYLVGHQDLRDDLHWPRKDAGHECVKETMRRSWNHPRSHFQDGAARIEKRSISESNEKVA